MTLASVAVSRLVDFDRLPALLLDMGFEGVNFSYPRRERRVFLPSCLRRGIPSDGL